MVRELRWLLLLLVLALVAPISHALGQGGVPTDFELIGTAGGTKPWSEVASVRIQAGGQGRFVRYVAGDPGAGFHAETSFTLSGTELGQVWQAVQGEDFFGLDQAYRDPSFSGGAFARLLVRANGSTHVVTIENVALEAVSAILSAINDATPAGSDLEYEPAEHVEVIPVDVCDRPGKLGSMDPSLLDWKGRAKGYAVSGVPRAAASAITATSRAAASANETAPHAGTTVGYHIPLQDAVSRGIAHLEGKGGYFGDQVSITVDNSGNHASSKLVTTLYLEFYGSHATAANAQQIKNAIEDAWSGKQTSGGTTMTVDVKTKVHSGASQPPGSPGYHQIELVGKTTSFVGDFGSFGVNNGTGTGTWETIGDDLDQVYAHEAGHLMGFDDKYDDFEKQPDGTWQKTDGSETLTSDELAERLLPSHPNSTKEQLKAGLDQPENTRATVPHAGSENDLLADLSGDVLTEYIDALASQAGLVVEVRPGDILVNKDGSDQNFAIIRSEDVFVPPGGSTTLGGLYTACIDASKGVPGEGQVFDVTLGLEQWRGIEAAALLLNVLQLIDAQERFCSSDALSQVAIWRVTDNVLFGNFALEQLAGITLGDEMLDFPRLGNPNADSPVSTVALPLELFVTQISPRRTVATVGSSITLNGSLAVPDVDGLSVSTSWFLQPPPGSSAALSVQDGQASLTVDQRGFYEIGFNVSVSGITPEDTTFTRAGARVVARDQQMDRFERDVLASHAFPWVSSGHVPWEIASEVSHTGTFSAVSGEIEDDQESVLEMSFSLPSDGHVAFAYRVSSEDTYDALTFHVNGEEQGRWSGDVDWSTASFPVSAGNVTLTWAYSKDESFSSGSDRSWLDDVFIPQGAVGVSIVSGADVPDRFALLQNYPNPFNPLTIIPYELPISQRVTLTVYDVLGREIVTLVDDDLAAGRHRASFDGRALPSGVYVYRLSAGDYVEVRKMMLVR